MHLHYLYITMSRSTPSSHIDEYHYFSFLFDTSPFRIQGLRHVYPFLLFTSTSNKYSTSHSHTPLYNFQIYWEIIWKVYISFQNMFGNYQHCIQLWTGHLGTVQNQITTILHGVIKLISKQGTYKPNSLLISKYTFFILKIDHFERCESLMQAERLETKNVLISFLSNLFPGLYHFSEWYIIVTYYNNL